MVRGRPPVTGRVEDLERSNRRLTNYVSRLESIILGLTERLAVAQALPQVPVLPQVDNRGAGMRVVLVPANPPNNTIEGVENPMILPAGNDFIVDTASRVGENPFAPPLAPNQGDRVEHIAIQEQIQRVVPAPNPVLQENMLDWMRRFNFEDADDEVSRRF